MADYQLTANPSVVIRIVDNAYIPDDPANRDYQGYLAWVEAGGVPDPYVAPESGPPTPTSEQQVLFDHENRILAMEGYPPLTIGDFLKKTRG